MRDPAPRLLRVLEEDAALAPLAHALGSDGLARARHATALVEGCGAVGAGTARLWLASGLRRLVLVDLPHALSRVVTRDDLAANALLAEADVAEDAYEPAVAAAADQNKLLRDLALERARRRAHPAVLPRDRNILPNNIPARNRVLSPPARQETQLLPSSHIRASLIARHDRAPPQAPE